MLLFAILQDVARLAVKCLADGVQRGEVQIRSPLSRNIWLKLSCSNNRKTIK
jgi:hypothetical protein